MAQAEFNGPFTADDDSSSEITSLRKEVADLQRAVTDLQAKYQFILDAVDRSGAVPSGRSTRWRFTPRMPRSEKNLYPVETNGVDHWRWVGPEPWVGFSLNLDRTRQLSIKVGVFGFVDEDAQNTFQLYVDGEPCAWSGLDGDTYSAVIDVAEEAGERTQIILRSKQSGRLETLFGEATDGAKAPAADERVLSFALKSIEIEPL